MDATTHFTPVQIKEAILPTDNESKVPLYGRKRGGQNERRTPSTYINSLLTPVWDEH